MTSVQTSVRAPCSYGFTIKFVVLEYFGGEICSKNLVAFMSTVYLVKSLFCRNILVEYEFKLEKLKGMHVDRLKSRSGNTYVLGLRLIRILKYFGVRIFARRTLLLFGCISIHVRMCILS